MKPTTLRSTIFSIAAVRRFFIAIWKAWRMACTASSRPASKSVCSTGVKPPPKMQTRASSPAQFVRAFVGPLPKNSFWSWTIVVEISASWRPSGRPWAWSGICSSGLSCFMSVPPLALCSQPSPERAVRCRDQPQFSHDRGGLPSLWLFFRRPPRRRAVLLGSLSLDSEKGVFRGSTLRCGGFPADVFLLYWLLGLLHSRLLGLLDSRLLGLFGLLKLRLLWLLYLRLLGLRDRTWLGGLGRRDHGGLYGGLLHRLGLLRAVLLHELPEMVDAVGQRPSNGRVDAVRKLPDSSVEVLEARSSVVALARADALVDPLEAGGYRRRGLRGNFLTAAAAGDQEGDEKPECEQPR